MTDRSQTKLLLFKLFKFELSLLVDEHFLINALFEYYHHRCRQYFWIFSSVCISLIDCSYCVHFHSLIADENQVSCVFCHSASLQFVRASPGLQLMQNNTSAIARSTSSSHSLLCNEATMANADEYLFSVRIDNMTGALSKILGGLIDERRDRESDREIER